MTNNNLDPLANSSKYLVGRPGVGKTSFGDSVPKMPQKPLHIHHVVRQEVEHLSVPLGQEHSDVSIGGPVITLDELDRIREDPVAQEWIASVLINPNIVNPKLYLNTDKH